MPTPRLSITKSKKSSKQPAAAAAMAQAPSPPPPVRPGSPPGKGSTAELAGKLAVSQALVGVSMGQTVPNVALSGSSNPADLTGVRHLSALTLHCGDKTQRDVVYHHHPPSQICMLSCILSLLDRVHSTLVCA